MIVWSISGEFGCEDCHPEELENGGHVPLAYPSIPGSHTAQISLLVGIRGTHLEVKCFGNIVEFKAAPHLSTEIIFQMAIISVLRLCSIPTNTAYIVIYNHMSREEAIRFFLEKLTISKVVHSLET